MLVLQPAQILAENEWITAGSLHDARQELCVDAAAGQLHFSKSAHRGQIERGHGHACHRPAAECLDETVTPLARRLVAAHGCHQTQGHMPPVLCDTRENVEAARIEPLAVVDDQEHRTVLAAKAEQEIGDRRTKALLLGLWGERTQRRRLVQQRRHRRRESTENRGHLLSRIANCVFMPTRGIGIEPGERQKVLCKCVA